jgi:hypothetical protein
VFTPTTPIAALNIDWNLGSTFTKTISTNSAFTFSNTNDGQTIVVVITDTGAFTATWPETGPNAVEWSNGVVPTQTPSGTDVYTFIDISGTIYGSVAQDFGT